MIKINSLKFKTKHSADEVKAAICKKLKIKSDMLISYRPLKISLDARRKNDIKYIYSVEAEIRNEAAVLKKLHDKDISVSREVIYEYEHPKTLKSDVRPVIIGAGPAGLFCAYKLAEAGLRPIIYERGKSVESRLEDVNKFWETGRLNTESNVQFGEGGAGTFSDGKLNTMVHDSYGRIKEVFRIFVEHGADESITYINKPHIGTDELREIIIGIRKYIISCGGEIHYNSLLNEIVIKNGAIQGIKVNDEFIDCKMLVLAIGHSARDTFEMLNKKGIAMERKAFAIGVRVQHPQKLIGMSQYGDEYKNLPAADYKLTYNSPKTGRGVYSFCMCPGGFVVNASSENGMLAVNGMSNNARDEESANSAIVVTVKPEDFDKGSVLDGVYFQRELERKAYEEGKGLIPVQYYGDFVKNRISTEFNENIPNTKGKTSFGNLKKILPCFISEAIEEAFPHFEKSINGFSDDNALLLGLESRTSSPVRLNRNDDFESIGTKGLYPCGEGAGYAGGITSSAVDGLKVFEAIYHKLETEEILN